MKLKKNTLILLAFLIIIAIAATVVFAAVKNSHSEADEIKAGELAALSGLSEETVLKLFDAVGSWDTLRQNIFVYKRILTLVKDDSAAYDEVFDLAGQFEAKDMLIVYEFLESEAPDFDQAENILKAHAKGTSMEAVLAAAVDTKTYKVYLPADDEQVRGWLNSGYTPQDIINADLLARAKDKSIAAVIALKNESTTWEQVGKKYGYKFRQTADKPATIQIRGVTGTRSVSGKDYEEIVKKSNSQAEEDMAALEEQVCRDFGLTAAQIDEYKSQGFGIREIENAARLAGKSGASMDKILQERKDGKTWAAIIETYSG